MKPSDRVLGWDFLRGLCALAVAVYHLLFWQRIAEVHTLGSYGVYLFFILSGASLAYTYSDRLDQHTFSYRGFLKVRFLRLAPLYILLMLLVLPWKIKQLGAPHELLLLYASNASFLFGFYNPATHAVLVGGWSLGIEAIFYLLFPLFMLSCRTAVSAWFVFAALVALQIGWIAATMGQASEPAQHLTAYHQAPAFAAYFMGGCMLGAAKRRGQLAPLPLGAWGVAPLLVGFGLLLALNPLEWSQSITGWRGFACAGICFLMVYSACRVDLSGVMARVSPYFGDATYGLYLLHPVIFFGCTLAIFPRLSVPPPTDWSLSARLGFGLLVLVSACCLALLSEKYLEKPIRERLKPQLRPTPAALTSH